MQKYYFFIDESWDHSLKNLNEDFPYFLLCGVLISEENYRSLEQKIIALKQEIFDTDKVILHSREIRKCEGYFKKLFDLQVKQQFYEALDQIIIDTPFTLISNAVKKIEYIKQYWKSAINPYHISLSYMLERMIFCLDEKQADQVEIYVEKRGKKEDGALHSHYNTVIDQWTYFVNSQRFKAKIEKFSFKDKRENDIGIQIADLCAYPLISFVRSPDKDNPAFKIIEPKIYINPKTEKQAWLKMIP